MQLAHEDVQARRRHRVLGHAGPPQREPLDHGVGVQRVPSRASTTTSQPGVQAAALQAKRPVAGQVERGQPQVEVAHVDVRAHVERPELDVVGPHGHESAGDVREGDGGAARGRGVVRRRPSSRMSSARHVRAGCSNRSSKIIRLSSRAR